MRNQRFIKVVACCMLVVLAVSSAQGAARSSSSGRGRFGLYGDWDIKIKFGEREMQSILAFSRDQEGNLTGQSIYFWGVGELKDVKFEEGSLSFTQTYRFGENESTSKFAGKIEEGKLTGTTSSDRGDSEVTGKRSLRIPRAAGSWEMKFTRGEQEYTSTLVVKADKEGKLTAEMKSERVEHTISDVLYERGSLTFKRKTTMGDREWESTFEGSIDRQTDTLSGVVKSDRGESTTEGKRIGTALIGTWNLEVASERGTRKQRLKVNSDLSGLYGSIPVKKVNFDGDKVSFKTVLEFGEQKYEMNFAGKIAEAKLTGELKTSRGTSKITGKKVVRTFRRRSSSTTQ